MASGPPLAEACEALARHGFPGDVREADVREWVP